MIPHGSKTVLLNQANSMLKVAITLKDLNRQEMWPH